MAKALFGDYKNDLSVALQAVRLASRATATVQKSLKKSEIETKDDRSPVTIADYAAQAIIIKHLSEHLGNATKFVAEEETSSLRERKNSGLLEEIVEIVEEVSGPSTQREVLEMIDLGNHDASAEKFWTLDPIDGTKGFIRGQQYAISLGLIEEGQVVLGVLGCPNLPLDQNRPFDAGDDEGGLYFAVKEAGSWSIRPDDEISKKSKISISSRTHASECLPCESVESSHSKLDFSGRIFRSMAVSQPPCRLDSQCKYAVVARGQADIYLRIPTDHNYQEKIWDHAAGALVASEAGAKVTDIRGKPLNFHYGKTLRENEGIACAIPAIHSELLRAISNTL